ncbi:MAG: MFS transporter [Bacteroidota bacterium]
MYTLGASYIITSLVRWISAFLIPLVIQEITDSAFFTSLSFAVSIAPSVLVLPIAGVMGDWLHKKRIIQICELCNIVVLSLLIITPFQWSYIYVIFLLDFLLNALATIHHPIFQAMVPLAVPKENINYFNAYLGATGHLIAILGPILVSLSLQVMDKKSMLYLLIGAYLCSFLLVSLISYSEKRQVKSFSVHKIFTAFYEGFHYVKTHPFLGIQPPSSFFLTLGWLLSAQISFTISNTIAISKRVNWVPTSSL